MMNFLPQGYSFESHSNPYQSQFVSPYYGSGQYGWQYSPMAQTGPRLPTCEPGTCPPWLPPGMIATPSSGVQELSVLFDPTLAARMATAYNPWTVAQWGKPDNPAWLWPDGAAPTPIPPNVQCDLVFPPGDSGPGPGPGREPTPTPGPTVRPGSYQPPTSTRPTRTPGPTLTPGVSPTPKSTQPIPTPGPSLTPGISPTPKSSTQSPNPRSPLRRGMFNSRWSRASAPVHPPILPSMPTPSAATPSVRSARPSAVTRRLVAPSGVRSDKCYAAPDKGACYKCCVEGKSGAARQKCLNQCIGLPEPKPQSPGMAGVRSANRRVSRLARSARRRNPLA